MSARVLIGHVLDKLAELPAASIQCCVTSPPYFGLRDYEIEDQVWPDGWSGSFGLEPTVDLYIEHLVVVFRAVHRVLRHDGTLWLNLGDSYAGSWGAQSRRTTESDDPTWHSSQIKNHPKRASNTGSLRTAGVKPKDLYGVPWLAAFALRADGWYLRRDIIWSKPNPMPESVTDRPTSAHEYLFLLSKSERYFYDAEAIKEASVTGDMRRPYGSPGANALDGREAPQGNGQLRKIKVPGGWDRAEGAHGTIHREGRTSAEYQDAIVAAGRNKRSVWTVPSAPFPEAHFATFPPALVEPCILAGCPEFTCPDCGTGLKSEFVNALRSGTDGTELSALRGDLPEASFSEGAQQVLQSPMCKRGEEACDGALPGMWPASLAGSQEQATEVLQHSLRQSVYGQEPGLDEGLVDHRSGISNDPCQGSSRRDAVRLRDGAPLGDGASAGQVSHRGRGGSSQKRRPPGQSSGEPGGSSKISARQARQGEAAPGPDKLPALRRGNPPEQSCPHCSRPLTFQRLGRGVTLDPFGGSGTVGLVADRLKRHSILVELNPEYAAALRLGRKFTGIEIEERWFDVACRRIEAEARQARLPIDETPQARPSEQGALL